MISRCFCIHVVQVLELIEQLTEAIHAAAAGKATWEYFLEKLVSEMPEGRAALVVHSSRNIDGYALFSDGDRIDNDYNQYSIRINPLQPILASKPVGFIGSDAHFSLGTNTEQTELYNDILLANRMRRIAWLNFAKSNDEIFSLIIGCGAHLSADALQDLLGMLAKISPHLRRALTMRSRVDAAVERCIPALMGAVNVDALILDREQRVRSASNMANNILDEAGPLRILADGRIRFRQQEVQTACSAMLNRYYSGPVMQDFFSHGTKLSLVRLNKDPSSLYFEGATAVVLVRHFRQRSTDYDQKLFGADFKLSKGEMRAMAGIVDGRSMSEVALEAGLSRETIRSQFKSLYAKTGARGEADILRLLHRGWQRAEPGE